MKEAPLNRWPQVIGDASPQSILSGTGAFVVLSNVDVCHHRKRCDRRVADLKVAQVPPIPTIIVMLRTSQVVQVRTKFTAGCQSEAESVSLSAVVIKSHVPTIQNVKLRISLGTEGVIHPNTAVLEGNGVAVEEGMREVTVLDTFDRLATNVCYKLSEVETESFANRR